MHVKSALSNTKPNVLNSNYRISSICLVIVFILFRKRLNFYLYILSSAFRRRSIVFKRQASLDCVWSGRSWELTTAPIDTLIACESLAPPLCSVNPTCHWLRSKASLSSLFAMFFSFKLNGFCTNWQTSLCSCDHQNDEVTLVDSML